MSTDDEETGISGGCGSLGCAAMILCAFIGLAMPEIIHLIHQHDEEHTKSEAMRAGLVQKIESGQPIWVKP